jgi:hypothetical protein
MNKTLRNVLAGVAALAVWAQAPAATIDLAEYAFNIDGIVTNGSAPAGVNVAGFDTATGLGKISVALSSPGSHQVSLFVDHEIAQAFNTFFNEIGTSTGSAAAGQSWEIDEPGFVFGDIYANFVAGTLDNSIGTTEPEDVSMALAWDFTIPAGETAIIEFYLSETLPAGGFYLTQSDSELPGAFVYFWSDLYIGGIPEPNVLLLVGAALLALLETRRRSG